MKVISLIAFVLAATFCIAGGPLMVSGPTYTNPGQPLAWDNSTPIRYRTDGGGLGSISNNSDLLSRVAAAFDVWAQVPSAKLSFQRAGTIQGIADGNVSTMAELNTVFGTCAAGSQTPIIFDDSSSTLLQAMTGDSSVLGITAPCLWNQQGKIQSAMVVLGNPSVYQLTAAELKALMVHEFGHLLGLDHSDLPPPFETGTTQADIDNTATMASILLTDKQATPAPDDVAWISKLYPSATMNSSFGTISGQVLFSGGKYPVKNFLVIARSVTQPHAVLVGNFSGYRFSDNPGQSYTDDYMPCVPANVCTNGTWGHNPGTEFGSHDATLIGLYELLVPPGQYTIEIRAVSGSQWQVPGPDEYWNDGESASDPAMPDGPLVGTPINVNAGQTITNINVIVNGTDPDFDIFEKSQASLLDVGRALALLGRDSTLPGGGK